MNGFVTWRWLALSLPVLALSVAAPAVSAGSDDNAVVEVRGGTAAFDAATNISAIRIHGKSAALEGRAWIRPGAAGLVIDRLEAGVPVNSLNTGMGLRDEHMRKYVFTTPDGKLPDLRFEADKAVCSGSDSQSTCQLSGQLAIRGTPRPFNIALKVTREGSAFRAIGDGIVKLSTYGIPAPSQLGVRTEDDVKLRVEFVARPSSGAVGTGGVR
jgi:polyisoprenoid-binding protein YceI